MNEQNLVYIIDDDAENIEIIKTSLSKDGNNLRGFTSAKDCIQASGEKIPDIFLCDVNMPEMNGFEFCEAIKENPAMSQVPVIFISALDSAEDVLKGYNVGGIDYLTRPFRPQELAMKVSNTLSLYNHMHKLESRAHKAKNTAFKAMNDAQRMKIVLGYMDSINLMNDPRKISEKLFDIFNDLNLKTSIFIKTIDNEYFYSSDNIERPMEKHLLYKFVQSLPEYIDKTGRFKEFNGRMIITFDHVSLLIKNYEIISCDDILDFITSLTSVINNRLSAIMVSIDAIRKRQKEVNQVAKLSAESLGELKARTKEYEKRIVYAMDHVLTQFNIEFSRLNLIEDEEEKLTSIVETAMQELTQIFCSGVDLERRFETVINKFSSLLSEEIKNNEAQNE